MTKKQPQKKQEVTIFFAAENGDRWYWIFNYLDEAEAYVFFKVLFGIVSNKGCNWDCCKFLSRFETTTKVRKTTTTTPREYMYWKQCISNNLFFNHPLYKLVVIAFIFNHVGQVLICEQHRKIKNKFWKKKLLKLLTNADK